MKIVNIEHLQENKYPYGGYLEIWNPTPEDLINLEPYLEENKKVCLPWVFGDAESVPDFSSVSHDRIALPFYLGRTRQEAYEEYLKIRTQVIQVLEGE